LSKALAAGHRNFKYLALSSTYDGEGFDGPCRKCKSLIRKYAPDLKLLLVKNKDDMFECSINDLSNNNEKPALKQEHTRLPRQPQQFPQQQFVNIPQQKQQQQQQQYIPVPVAHYVLGPQSNPSPYPYYNQYNRGQHGFFRNYW
jgi:hypothetical protein